jgi:hypothetical protein
LALTRLGTATVCLRIWSISFICAVSNMFIVLWETLRCLSGYK